jgi:hypothetical protein
LNVLIRKDTQNEVAKMDSTFAPSRHPFLLYKKKWRHPLCRGKHSLFNSGMALTAVYYMKCLWGEVRDVNVNSHTHIHNSFSEFINLTLKILYMIARVIRELCARILTYCTV